ncbi:hypothetical protein [Candidatus Similichlamydia epinepheli]|uniref:hypothetical protein n=1 Tax=Candidatus Similichlamydia epinepheli TaxID=1903953 RepID=UPI000D363B26|nr:hypothetical protein [Candidatus Similichlamydia epinepheli]
MISAPYSCLKNCIYRFYNVIKSLKLTRIDASRLIKFGHISTEQSYPCRTFFLRHNFTWCLHSVESSKSNLEVLLVFNLWPLLFIIQKEVVDTSEVVLERTNLLYINPIPLLLFCLFSLIKRLTVNLAYVWILDIFRFGYLFLSFLIIWIEGNKSRTTTTLEVDRQPINKEPIQTNNQLIQFLVRDAEELFDNTL